MVVRRALFQSPRATKRQRVISPVATKQYVQRAIRNNAEFKYRNTGGPYLTAGTTNGVNVNLSPIPAGTGKTERIGTTVLLTQMELRLFAAATNGLRVVIYVPKTATDNFANTINFNSGTDNNRFWVWHDEFYKPDGTTTDASLVVNLKFNKMMNMTYGSSSGTDFEKNPIKMYLYAENQSGIGLQQVDGTCKCWFKDK